MTPRLAILTGTLAGQTRPLGAARLSLGRDALCEVRFDPTADPEVSARHAEFRVDDGVAIVRDTNSTNGVYVNDVRVRGEQRLSDGDIVRLGARGPRIRFESGADSTRPGGATTQRIALAVKRQTRGLRAALVAAVTVALCAAGVGVWSSRRSQSSQTAELELLRCRNDSLSAAIDRDLHAMTGRLAGLDSALAAARHESDGLRAQLATARTDEGVNLLSERIARAESHRGAIMAAARMDYEAIARSNGKAVVMIAVEMSDGTLSSGSGISVRADGTILTNRHMVRGADDTAPSRIGVVYADTKEWLPARVERVAGDADVAVLRIDRPGAYPFVDRVADHAPQVGAPVAIIGYPLGSAVPMDTNADGITVRSTLAVGTVSKSIPGVLQIDAFATDGSSGSPVFGEDGSIVGIVYGGAREAAGRIVYAVPTSAVRAILR